MDFANGVAGEEPGERIAAQGDYEPGLDQLDLTVEVGSASLDLGRKRIAVVRGTALDDVSNVDLVSSEPNRGQHFFEESSGRTDEWARLLIFVEARAFAHKHDFGGGRAFSRDGVSAGFAEVAVRTRGYACIQLFEGTQLDRMIA